MTIGRKKAFLNYDSEGDILYIATKEGEEEEFDAD